MEGLKTKRGTIKGQLTRFANFIKLFKPATSKAFELQSRLEKIECLWNEFFAIQTEIEKLDVSEDQQLEREDFENNYFTAVGTAKDLIAQTQVFDTNLASGQNANNVLSQNDNLKFSNVKLPKISLVSYSGAPNKWTQFYDTFSSLVDNNKSLSNVQKFHYLQDTLKDSAAEVIEGLELTDANYDVAWSLLKERFQNKKLIINSHMQQLFNLSSISKASASALRQLECNFLKNYRSLKNLKEPVEHWDTILLHLITTKLDHQTRENWESYTKDIDSPTITKFTSFLAERCQLLERIQGKYSTHNDAPRKPFEHKSKSLLALAEQTPICVFCKGSHRIFGCKNFLDLDIPNRLTNIKGLNLCTNCLKGGHTNYKCRAGECRRCHKRHNTLLHLDNHPSREDPVKEPVTKVDAAEDHVPVNIAAHCLTQGTILLCTAVAHIQCSNGSLIKCRILLDNGSQSNFMTRKLFDKLNLKSSKIRMAVSGINSTTTYISDCTEAKISSLCNNFIINQQFLISDKITEKIPQNKINIDRLKIPEHIILADPHFDEPSDIDVLLGGNTFFTSICDGQIGLGHGQPILQRSHFGWLIAGPISFNAPANIRTSCNIATLAQIHTDLEKFWHIDESPITKFQTNEDSECEEHFLNNYKRDHTGRIIVRLPVKENLLTKLGDSQSIAIRQFHAIERRLANDSKLRQLYIQFMNEYIQLGHMTRIDPAQDNSKILKFYLPHHGVVKRESTTTPLRVVFNASCKTEGLSLNDVLKVGPTIQQDLFSIILRFRKPNIVITADITKMYRQVLIDERDRDLQRIVWRSNPDDALDHYQLNTITYGTASASFLACRALKQCARDNEHQFPHASQVIANDFYVDDVLTGCDDINNAKKLIEDLNNALNSSGFKLRKWLSNKKEVLEGLRNTSCESSYIISDNQQHKTLGILWNPREDNFQFKNNYTQKTTATKRNILALVAQIFDPLGLIGPCTIKAKIIMQKLWTIKLGWDEVIPDSLRIIWAQFLDEIPHLNSIIIPRQISHSSSKHFQIHGFSDASQSAFGACIYLRTISEQGVILVRLICAKSKVAPLKTITLPRLELCAALLLTQLLTKATTALQIKTNNLFLWTDSTIVLAWLSTQPANLNTFVANRVSQIQQNSNINQWHHVPSGDNAADIISRGMNPAQLSKSNLWFSGPNFLSSNEENWPKQMLHANRTEVPETKTTTLSFVINHANEFLSDLFNKFSKLSKLIRIVAYCYRFYHNCKLKGETRTFNDITSKEFDDAKIQLIRIVQRESFTKEIDMLIQHRSVSKNSKLLSLHPFLENGLIRVGGRLLFATLNYDQKFPYVLPSHHNFTKLLILEEHHKNLHAGAKALLYNLRTRFWIINGQQTIRSILRKCITCFKVKPNLNTPYLMGNLPAPRVIPTCRAFSKVGVDYAGPFSIKDGKTRNRKIVKAYVCVFICLATKAIHLELVGDLTSEGFLNAFKRFVSRRGLCHEIFSDNATNFVGSYNQLKRHCLDNQITWHFIPPRTPHFGGIWEAAVKSFKFHLKRIIQNVNLTFEEFYTIVTQVEAVLNSRPLTPLSEDPNDLQALTPGHFLIGSTIMAVPQENVIDQSTTCVQRYKLLQKMFQHFWSRWSHDYLNNLQQRTKWKSRAISEFQVGSLVIIKNDNDIPLYWKMGRVVELHPGTDKIVRVVTVKTSNGLVKRGVKQLCIIPVESPQHDINISSNS